MSCLGGSFAVSSAGAGFGRGGCVDVGNFW